MIFLGKKLPRFCKQYQGRFKRSKRRMLKIPLQIQEVFMMKAVNLSKKMSRMIYRILMKRKYLILLTGS